MGKRIKVVYIISDINKSLPFEWLSQYIDKKKFDISFIFLNPGSSYLEEYLRENNFEVYRVRCEGKKDWFAAIIQTFKLLKKIAPDVVHCHLMQANMVGLTASRLAGIKKRIYTRHHSSEHHVYFSKGVWLDKIANRLATHIVAISSVVKKILVEWENVNPNKVVLIPHGFLLYEFSNVDESRINLFKRRHNIEGSFPIIGVISRFTKWKGIQYIIPAFRNLLSDYPDSKLLLLNAKGDYESQIREQLTILPENTYRAIVFENDISAVYKSLDVFVHVPIDEHSEAFGQIYIEVLSAGIPSVFTKSGIANEPEFNDSIGVIVDYKNSDQIYEGILEILRNQPKTKDRILAGKELADHYNLIFYIERLEQLYS